MRRLIIMRHAEAETAPPGADDFGRTLTPAGRAAARRAAERLHAEQGLPALLLHSPALRTTETARIVAETLAPAVLRAIAVPGIYLAKGKTLQRLLEEPAHRADCVLLVGHNPGVSELLQLLDADAARTRRWLTPAEFAAIDR